jgi:hypothetical protein
MSDPVLFVFVFSSAILLGELIWLFVLWRSER